LDSDGSDDTAAEIYKEALAMDSTLYPVWQQLFVIYGNEETADSLVKYAHKAAPLFPENPFVLYFESLGHLFKKQYQEAVPLLNEGLSLAKNEDTALRVQFHSFLGDAYQEVGTFAEADSH